MSLLSQFFPSGGGGSKIHLEVLAVSGGGGAGRGPETFGSYIVRRSGGGGGGAAYQGRLDVEPGSTVPITIGAGGAASTGLPSCTGLRGGDTVVKYPEGTIRVMGGGGGLGSSATAIDPASTAHGGTGGGGGCVSTILPGTCNFFRDSSGPSNVTTKASLLNRHTGRSIYSKGNAIATTYCAGPTSSCALIQYDWNGSTMTPHGNGAFYGAPGNLMYTAIGSPGSCYKHIGGGGGGGAGGNGFILGGCPATTTIITEVAGPGIFTEMTGTMEEFGRGGMNLVPATPNACAASAANSGQGGSNRCGGDENAGGSGVVIIRYPTDFSAAPASPGATDCSPVTPGYYTYRFNSSGSITLP
jgi:hypothetical protein